jgi:hypothetical protein
MKMYLISEEDRQYLVSIMDSNLYPIALHLGNARKKMWQDMIDFVKGLKPVEQQEEPASLLPVVRMKCEAEGPFSADTVRSKMMEICGCLGQHDCDCVSVKNKAIGQLYYKHNSGQEPPKDW